MRKLTLSTVLAAALAIPAAAQTIYVDSAIATPGNGTSWATAYKSLSNALAAAPGGSTVWVGSGGYFGTFTIPAGVTVLGMFFSDSTSPSGVGHTSFLQRDYQNRTTLWATTGGTVVTMGAGSVLDGFFLQGGTASGALIDGVDCKIRNCFFQRNNDAGGGGAALQVRNGANPRIENSVFTNNGDAASGAAIEIDGASGTYINLTIDLNYHSGMHLKGNATPKIYNTIFSSNGVTPNTTAYGVEQQNTGANPTLSHNLFWANNTGHYLHGANALTTIGAVNALGFVSTSASADPLYNARNDWRLVAASPCVDTGHPTIFTERTQGLYNSPRRVDGNLDGVLTPDIGAAEFNNVTMQIPVDTHTHVHLGVGGTAGLPAFLVLDVGEWPNGLYLYPVGHVFVGLSSSTLIAPYGSIPTAGNMAVNYPPGVPPGLNTYWQALTFGGSGLNISNPGVHVTN